MTTTVEPLRPRTRRGAELLLLLLAIAIVLLAWVTTDLNRNGTVPANIIPVAGGFTVLALAVPPRAALEGGLRRPASSCRSPRCSTAWASS